MEYMREALRLAAEAADAGEVPVGCVVVHGGQIVGRGRNRREALQRTDAHAELEAIAQANAALGTWRLDECDLYVTLEPCPMCAGAILNGRFRRVYFGARDRAMGACGGVFNLFMEDFPNKTALQGGIMEAECREMLSAFFSNLRDAENLRSVHDTRGDIRYDSGVPDGTDTRKEGP
ncbi:MAG: nucleoside deaminase [Oscillibacter sp.]|nr:nucleoside deaminase [Oscillibacter sp.]